MTEGPSVVTLPEPPKGYTFEYKFVLITPMPRQEFPFNDQARSVSVGEIKAWWPGTTLLVETVE